IARPSASRSSISSSRSLMTLVSERLNVLPKTSVGNGVYDCTRSHRKQPRARVTRTIVQPPSVCDWPIELEEIGDPGLIAPPHRLLWYIMAARTDAEQDAIECKFCRGHPQEHQVK